jgi:NDP-sugar pyrophosphorylase family protein
MQVVILAGGLGTRLRPITERVPKPMVEVGDRPFLEYIVTHLAAQGFDRFLILLGYLGDHVKRYFGDGARWGISISYASEPHPLGTAGAIRNAYDSLEPEFILLYGDSYLPIDYQEVVREFHSAPCQSLMVVYDNRTADTGVLNNVALEPDGVVTKYLKGQAAPDLKYVEAGVLCFQREVFRDLPALQPVALEQEIYARLIGERQIRAFLTRQRFFDIGTPDRLEAFIADNP